MRRSGLSAILAVLVVAALIGAAVRWIWVHDAPDPITASSRTDRSVSGGDPAASAADADAPAARVVEPTVAAPATRGRFGARGVVRFADDGRPAPGATVRAWSSPPPLSRLPYREAMRRVGSSREPAAVHDVSGLLEDDGPASRDEARSDRDEARSDDPIEPPAEPEPSRPEGRKPLAETVADESGRFELLGLVRSSFHLEAAAPAAVTQEAVHLEFGEDGEDRVRDDVELLLLAGARVRGTVRTPDGRPVPGAEVWLGAAFDPFSMFAAGGLDLRAPDWRVTDDLGAFEFAAVPAPLELKARASATGFAASEAASVTTRAGATAEVALVVAPGGTIEVRVTDESGAPMAGVRCRCEPTRLDLSTITDDARNWSRGGGRTDRAGVARFHGMAIGKWRVSADVAGRLAASQTVELASAGATAAVELRIEPGLELRGVVRARDGTPVDEARITAYLEPSLLNLDLTAMSGATGRRSGRSDAEGAFVVTGLPPGRLVVEARAPGYQTASIKAEAGAEPVEIALASRGVLEGIVVSRKTTKAVTSFEIRIARRRETSSLISFSPTSAEGFIDLTLPFATPNGKFRIVGVNPGTLRLAARAPGHGEQTTDWIDLIEGETRKGILIYLEPEAVIEGKVVDAATGAPVAGAEIRRDVGGGNAIENVLAQFLASADAKSDDEGRFRLDGLVAGTHRLVASHPRYVDGAAPATEVAPGQTIADLRIALERGGEIFGTVAGPGGAPAPGAAVICQELTRFKMRSVKADVRGEYRIPGLAAGSYTVTRMPESFDFSGENFIADITSSMQTHNVRLKPGESLRVDFTPALQGSASVRGTVRQAGTPAAGAMVVVFAQATGEEAGTGGMRTGMTGADGSYRIDGLIAGPAFVQVNQADLGMEGGQSAAIATATLREGETTTIDLEIPAGAVTGRVVDGLTGEPLAGVAVYAATAGEAGESMLELAMRRAATVRTDEKGAFRLRNLRGGVHRVVAGGSDLFAGGSTRHALVHRDGVAVPDGGTVDVGTLRLPPAAAIEGVVTDAAGRTLSGASIFLRDAGSGAYLEEWTAITSSDSGRFEYRGVPGGRWDVVCRAPGHATAVVRGVSAREGEVAGVSVKLIGGTEVFAHLGDFDFDKLVHLRLEVEGPEGRIPLTLFGLGDLQDLLARPWRPDVVRLGRFGPGRYVVRGRLGERTFEKTFELAGEPELHVPVSLP